MFLHCSSGGGSNGSPGDVMNVNFNESIFRRNSSSGASLGRSSRYHFAVSLRASTLSVDIPYYYCIASSLSHSLQLQFTLCARLLWAMEWIISFPFIIQVWRRYAIQSAMVLATVLGA